MIVLSGFVMPTFTHHLSQVVTLTGRQHRMLSWNDDAPSPTTHLTSRDRFLIGLAWLLLIFTLYLLWQDLSGQTADIREQTANLSARATPTVTVTAPAFVMPDSCDVTSEGDEASIYPCVEHDIESITGPEGDVHLDCAVILTSAENSVARCTDGTEWPS